MSLDRAVQPYVDQVKGSTHNRSSVGEKFDPEKDDVLRAAINAVVAHTDTHVDEQARGLIRGIHSGVIEGCRVAAINCLADNEEAGVGDVILAIRKELQKWANAPVSKLDWKADHILDLRRLGAHETEIVLTVRKSAGTQQIRQVVHFSIEVVQHSWTKQSNNWEAVAGTRFEDDSVFKEERTLTFLDPANGARLGSLLWSLSHIQPKGDTTSVDSLEYLGTE